MNRHTVVVAMAALGLLLAAPLARADTRHVIERQNPQANAFDGFQAGPCTGDTPVICSPTTSPQFFKTAGGHPPLAFVQFIVQHQVVVENAREPLVEPIRGRVPKTLRVDLPPGLTVNPQATPRCSLADFSHVNERGFREPLCSSATKVGESKVKIVNGENGFFGLLKGEFILPGVQGATVVPLFNLEPAPGEPALFGSVLASAVPIFLETELAWESDFHEIFRIGGLPDFRTTKLGGLIAPIAIHTARLVNFGGVGDGTFATLPTTCFDTADPRFSRIYSSWIWADSFEEPDPAFPLNTQPFEGKLPPGVSPEGCDDIPFDPSIEFFPRTFRIDSPSSPQVATKLKVEVPGGGGGSVAQSHLRTAELTLPAGMGLNPAGSAGLLACTDAQFRKGERVPNNQCPPGSIIGKAEFVTPALADRLIGDVYLGEQKSTDPASGEQFRIFVEGKSVERGVQVRLVGKVKADPKTGQLTTKFDDQLVGPLAGPLPHGLPQVPFESLTLKFKESLPLFTTPPTCSRSITTSRMEPWARPGTFATPTSSFTLPADPNGMTANCPQSMVERAFVPSYSAKVDSAQAGSHSPLRVRVSRPPGHQELKQLNLTLPKGVIGKLAGIPYCPEAAVAAAAAKSGAAEQKAASCPAQSLVGSTVTESGSGDKPLRLPGKVYLAGPYKGAALSVVAITPGLSGPFDLGNVVIRVALRLDPQTAQITAVSDSLPDVFGGVKLSLRTIDLDLDRPGFILNPTNCSAQAISGTASGGGADPTNPAGFSSYRVNAPFQASGCEGLGFAPRLITQVAGPKKRGKYPRLTATLQARAGDANLSEVALTLPRAYFVAQEHLTTLCTRVQFTSRSCPAGSVYGEAEASTPLLDGKLKGPVYLVPGGGRLPDLILDLRGQVDMQLRGVISSKGGGIRTVFADTPDVPLNEFVLRLAGGKKGLIVNSTNICKGGRFASLSLKAHSGKQVSKKKYRLKLPGCPKKKRKKRGKR